MLTPATDVLGVDHLDPLALADGLRLVTSTADRSGSRYMSMVSGPA